MAKTMEKGIKAECEKIIEEITRNMQSLENCLKHAGISTPDENVSFENKIKFPSGYIRKTSYFEKEYKLDLFDDNVLAKNIAYYLQYTDLLNYFMNRTTLGDGALSVGTIFRKSAIIVLGAICEAYFVGIIEYIARRCSQCKSKKDSCKIFKEAEGKLSKIHNKKMEIKFKKEIEYLHRIEALTSLEKDKYKELAEMRNRVHIQYEYAHNNNNKIRVFCKLEVPTFARIFPQLGVGIFSSLTS